MASTPFSTSSVAYQGLALPRDHSYTAAVRRFWLGQPSNMIQLPSPSLGYDVTYSQGESIYKLGSGRTAVRYLSDLSREWTLKFPKLYGRDWSVMYGFYRRLFGDDPWCFPAPEDTNRLTLAQSLCGNLNGVAEGWSPTVGTVAYDGTVTPAIAPSGVLRWSGAGSNSQLVAGVLAGSAIAADPLSSSPYIPAEPYTASAYLAKASGSLTARMQLVGVAADGVTVVATVNGTSTALSTTLSPLAVTAAAGALGASVYVLEAVQSLTAGAPDLLVSAAQLGAPGPWTEGMGVPRVVWANAPSGTLGSLFANDFSMVLSES